LNPTQQIQDEPSTLENQEKNTNDDDNTFVNELICFDQASCIDDDNDFDPRAWESGSSSTSPLNEVSPMPNEFQDMGSSADFFGMAAFSEPTTPAKTNLYPALDNVNPFLQ